MSAYVIAIVQNVKSNNGLGEAHVYESEFEAENDFPNYKNGKIICCGGYFNAIWQRYL